MTKPTVLTKKQIRKLFFENRDKFDDIGPEIADLINTPMGKCMGCYDKAIYSKIDNILSKYNTEIMNRFENIFNNKIEIYPY